MSIFLVILTATYSIIASFLLGILVSQKRMMSEMADAASTLEVQNVNAYAELHAKNAVLTKKLHDSNRCLEMVLDEHLTVKAMVSEPVAVGAEA